MTDRRQRQKEQRAARLEVEKKAASRKEFRRRIIIALGIGVGLVGVLVLTSVLGNRPQTLPASYQAYRQQPTACGAEAPPEVEIMSFTEPGGSGSRQRTDQSDHQHIVRSDCDRSRSRGLSRDSELVRVPC